MRLMHFAFLVVVLLSVSGCESSETSKFTCDDGSLVDDLSQCNFIPTTTTLHFTDKVMKCEELPLGEDRDICMIMVAVEAKQTDLCKRIQDPGWQKICFTKLNATQLMPSTSSTTSTTSSTTSSTSTTSTTLLCGNGIIDDGEDCDTGTLCHDFDGVCSLLGEQRKIAICLDGTSCQWNIQTNIADSRFDLGRCNGCFGPSHVKACDCVENLQVLNYTTTTLKTGHYKCSGGKCQYVASGGNDDCVMNRDCFHYSCDSGTCEKVDEPGNTTCESNFDCMTIWEE